MVALAEHNTGNPQQGNPKEKLSTRNKLIAAFGAGAVSVAAIFGVTHAMGHDEKSVPQENSATHDTPPPSVDVNGNPINDEVKSPESKVATGETLALLQAHSKNFDEWRGSMLDLLKKHRMLSTEEETFLESNYATLSNKSDKSTYTDNEVLAAVALDVADASAQDSPAEGRDMLPVVIGKQAEYFQDALVRIGNGKGAIIDIYSQSGNTLKHPKGTFVSENLEHTKDARVIIQTKMVGINGRTDVFTEAGVYVLNSDGADNEQWQVIARLDLSDPAVQAAVADLR